ncbi:MAG: tetratricopeptide repeat protein [Deltaproteobacteria bacterium]|nr:tetratricopeptide repeat protein [Deltaproteobacteria bacterium]
MAGKITKKDIEKPDSFLAAVNRISTYVKENKKKIYITSSVIAAIIVIATGWYLYKMNYENEAQKLYAKAHLAAMKNTMQGMNPDQNILKLYQEVITQYPGSKAAMMSSYQMGSVYYEIGNIDDSLKAYTEFIKEAPGGSDLQAMGYSGLGYCYESKKDWKNALESFEKASASKTGGSFVGITYRNIARIYEEMNNREKALEYYQKALSKNTDPGMELFLKRKISTTS